MLAHKRAELRQPEAWYILCLRWLWGLPWTEWTLMYLKNRVYKFRQLLLAPHHWGATLWWKSPHSRWGEAFQPQPPLNLNWNSSSVLEHAMVPSTHSQAWFPPERTRPWPITIHSSRTAWLMYYIHVLQAVCSLWMDWICCSNFIRNRLLACKTARNRGNVSP